MLAFVTGASAGFGTAIARRLVAEGHRVVGTGRRRERLDAVRDELGEAFLPLAFDIADRAATEATVAALPESWREIDLLVNNAGLALGLSPAQDADIDDWERMVDTNVKGLMRLTRLLLPAMVARGSGHVVMIGSVAGRYPYPGGNVYGATKAFVRQFALNLRADLHGTGVRVTDIQPGLVGGSEFSVVRFGGDESRAARFYADADPLTPEDIAETVHWVAALPPRVNINMIELMPVSQGFGALPVHRG